jgi:hypothetical protein
MTPPLVAGEETKKTRGAKPECVVHLAGTAQLSLDEQEAIRDWLEEVDKEPGPDNPFRRYIVRPHSDWYTAPETGRRLYRRFSCAGFVVECYGSVTIQLVNAHEVNLPRVDFGTLSRAYPIRQGDRLAARFGLTREDLGIPDPGPWPVLLPGYLFHALDRVSPDGTRPPGFTPSSPADAEFG